MIRLPCLTLHTVRTLGLVFGWEMEGIGTRVLHRSCSCICELDVRLLNQPIQTSTFQVMVHFPRLPQLRLFICLCPNFRTDFVLISGLIWAHGQFGGHIWGCYGLF